ncbi:hypothetical protein TSTA_097990 [Talaromyces stipitatus ATCC 10500]|uniref:Myb-like domain-containing protein n=1 Tax=Talaromyces stipitatus (strain ATCC 10500 / CBS 375.48 / QM 6759 / NRRL 1006) TaxID=441959 RepID=B8MM31_TALSN|nr:uncharacterized protein TSTA_097990 [Talaromyces stipitatus ATCC 10500]EED13543.1 hypothetical protein TSTA_097990 [Talaromyces stipitatus ATCC 10500]
MSAPITVSYSGRSRLGINKPDVPSDPSIITDSPDKKFPCGLMNKTTCPNNDLFAVNPASPKSVALYGHAQIVGDPEPASDAKSDTQRFSSKRRLGDETDLELPCKRSSSDSLTAKDHLCTLYSYFSEASLHERLDFLSWLFRSELSESLLASSVELPFTRVKTADQCAESARTQHCRPPATPNGRRVTSTRSINGKGWEPDEINFLVQLKEAGLPWSVIANRFREQFPGRSIGSIQTLKVTVVIRLTVAEARVLAFERPEAAGQRYLVANSAYSYQQICDIIREKFPELQGSTPKDTLGEPFPPVYRLDTSKSHVSPENYYSAPRHGFMKNFLAASSASKPTGIIDRFIRPHRENTRQPGFWKLANGGSDDKAGLEDQIESQSVEGLRTFEYATSQSSSLTPNDSASQIQSSTLINPFLEPPKPKRQQKETSWHRILDFQEIEDPDTGENLASIVYKVLCELDIKAKLISITSDNASNNLEMAEILHNLLKANYEQGNTQQIMRYQGEGSFICYLIHILNLIVKEFLAVLKASDITEDFQIIEDLENNPSLAQSQKVQEREGKFKDFDADVANAAKSAMRKYDKYYTLMDDSCDILYITMLLDPRFKKLVLEHELWDEAQDIITAMQEQLEIQYPITHKPKFFIASEEPGPSVTLQNPHKTIVCKGIDCWIMLRDTDRS